MDLRGLGLNEWPTGDPSRTLFANQVYRALVNVWSWAVIKFVLYMAAFLTDQDESSQIAFVFQAHTHSVAIRTPVSPLIWVCFLAPIFTASMALFRERFRPCVSIWCLACSIAVASDVASRQCHNDMTINIYSQTWPGCWQIIGWRR